MTELDQKIRFLNSIDLPAEAFSKPDSRSALINDFAATAARLNIANFDQLNGATLRLLDSEGHQLLDEPLFSTATSPMAEVPTISPDKGAVADGKPAMQAETDAALVFERSKNQAQMTGSALMAYQVGVDAVVREAISDSLLLAKLNADFIVKDFEARPNEWFKAYLKVLDNSGWVVSSMLFNKYEAEGKGADVHEAIIGLLGSVIGGATGGFLLAKSVLEALSKMDDGPWITLWKQQALYANVAQFQVGVASNDDEGRIVVGLASLRMQATKQMKQLLFLKWSATNAKIDTATQKIFLTKDTLLETAPIIRLKVAKARKAFLESVVNF